MFKIDYTLGILNLYFNFKSSVDCNNCLVIWTAVLAIATILLAAVAAFQDYIKRKIWKPKLELIIDFDKGGCTLVPSRIEKRTQVIKAGYPAIQITYHTVDTFYFRLEIWNKGNESAENVQVFISDLHKVVEEEKINRVKIFSQHNLKWNTFGEGAIVKYNWEHIPADTFQYINLGLVYEPNARNIHLPEEKSLEKNTVINEVFFALEVYMKSTSKDYILRKGTYFFKLLVTASNAKSKQYFFKFEFNGRWNNDIDTMLRENITLTKL